MHWNNNATQIRRELLVRLAKLTDENQLVEGVDRIPYEMVPKGSAHVRCCVHHDRAIIKYRLVARMGGRIEEYEDDALPLAHFAKQALEREKIEGPIITLVEEACHACVQGRYFVTNACQGCMARPCMMNCPKKAIHIENGHAVIDDSICVECGICTTACQYHAIIKIPVPCEEACPVGAVSKDEKGREQIDFEKCIYCGRCISQCPFGAMTDRSQIIDVIRKLKGDRPVVAMVAPAVLAQFRAEIPRILGAIKSLGFADVLEVARGADDTAELEAIEIAEHMDNDKGLVATSCCPAWHEAARKHGGPIAEHVSHTPSPMIMIARKARKLHPGCLTVFLGPCVAKRWEAIRSREVDFVLSSEELGAFFIARGVELDAATDLVHEENEIATGDGRGFAATAGVTNAVKNAIIRQDKANGTDHASKLRTELIDGLDRASVKSLATYDLKRCDVLEVMTCKGGCICGPSILVNPKIAAVQLKKQIAAAKAATGTKP